MVGLAVLMSIAAYAIDSKDEHETISESSTDSYHSIEPQKENFIQKIKEDM